MREVKIRTPRSSAAVGPARWVAQLRALLQSEGPTAARTVWPRGRLYQQVHRLSVVSEFGHSPQDYGWCWDGELQVGWQGPGPGAGYESGASRTSSTAGELANVAPDRNGTEAPPSRAAAWTWGLGAN